MKERKTIKHAVYTLEEKEKILELYMSGEKRPKVDKTSVTMSIFLI
jgi:hypothetical protein